MSWPHAIASKPPEAPRVSGPKLVKRVLRWITTDGWWALRRDDIIFESSPHSMFLLAHDRPAQTPLAEVAIRKPVSGSLAHRTRTAEKDICPCPLASSQMCSRGRRSRVRIRDSNRSITRAHAPSRNKLSHRDWNTIPLWIMLPPVRHQAVNVRPGCVRRPSCREPADSERWDRRCWSRGPEPAATAGRPR